MGGLLANLSGTTCDLTLLRYKTCLEEIKTVRKEHVAQEKLERNELKYLLEKKNTAERKKRERDQKARDMEALDREVEGVSQRLKPLEDELGEQNRYETGYSHIIAAKAEADARREQTVKFMEQMRGRLRPEDVFSDATCSDRDIEGRDSILLSLQVESQLR